VGDDALEPLLAEQVAYYRARAPEYLDGGLDLPGGAELDAALEAFAPAGDVLELACGPGTWTGQLLDHAATVTAVDAGPEMLAIARERIDDDRVSFVLADLFAWRPERRYDAVFFGFWLSHVPPSASPPSGRSWTTASRPAAASSSPMTPTARPSSSWRARRRRPFAGG
jgi:SAM-dependent methyltransferase